MAEETFADAFNRPGYTETVDEKTGVTTRSWKPALRRVVRYDREGYVLSVGMKRAEPETRIPGK